MQTVLAICAASALLLDGCGAGLQPPGPPAPLTPGLDWLAVLFVAVAATVWLTNRVNDRQRMTGRQPASRALEIARQRYAKGEIARDEYLRIREDLEPNFASP